MISKFLPLALLLTFVLVFPLCLVSVGICGPDEESATKSVDEAIESVDIYSDNVGDFLEGDNNNLVIEAWKTYQAGDYENAARYYLTLSKLYPDSATFLYNLSCCYGLLGESKKASLFLEYAFKKGYKDVDYIKKDPDFNKVRDSESFKSVMEKINSALEAEKKAAIKPLRIKATSLYNCYVQLPENYDPTKDYPLVIGLHNGGGDPQVFSKIFTKVKDREFIYASLEGVKVYPNGAQLIYGWGLGMPKDQNPDLEGIENTMEYITGAVSQLKQEYSVGKVYLLGFSEGCRMAYTTGILKHNLFNGLICIGGFIDKEVLSQGDIKAAKDLHILVIHATDDLATPYDMGRETYDVLVKDGYDASFVDYEGGHMITPEIMQKAADWIMSR